MGLWLVVDFHSELKLELLQVKLLLQMWLLIVEVVVEASLHWQLVAMRVELQLFVVVVWMNMMAFVHQQTVQD